MGGPVSWGPAILGLTWSFTILSTLFVAARLYVRGFIKNGLHSDDYWIITSVVCGYVSVGLGTAAVLNGYGDHFLTLSARQQQNSIMFVLAEFGPGTVSFSTPKLAVVALYCRLLEPSKVQRYIMWTLAIITNLSMLGLIGVIFGRCTPARSQWDFSVQGKCSDVSILVNYAIYCGAISAFSDFYLAIYPGFVLFDLQMAIRKKIILSVALGLGLISGALAIWKTTFIPKLASPDFTYDSSPLSIFAVVEGSVINIATTIPLLKPLVELVLDRTIFSSKNGSKNGSSSHYNSQLATIGGSKAKAGAKSHANAIELAARRPGVGPKTGYEDLEGGSQEDILGPTMGKSRVWIDSNSEEEVRAESKEAEPGAGITRTQETKVSYNRGGWK